MGDLEDREQIRELYARYCFYVDEGQPGGFAAQFVDDGILWLSDRGSYVGRDEIEAHVGRRSGKTFHLIHNVAIDRIEGDVAYAHAYFQLLDPETAATVAYGTYDDALRRVDGTWRWERKRVNYRFRTPDYAAGAATMQRPDSGQPLAGVPAFGQTIGG
jgi:3-phenylpropionate/cinnamic acid dioxygenase small subunit